MKAVSFTNSYDAEQQKIDQQMRYAEMLRQQSQQPLQGRMAGRVYVAPHALEGAAQMLKAYGGRKGVEQAQGQSMELANRRNEALVKGLQQYGQTGDSAALLSNPDTAGYGVQGMIGERQAQIAAQLAADKSSDDRRWREEQAAAERQWRMEQENSERQWQERQNELNRNARIQAGGGGQPYFQALPSADGYVTFDARRGTYAPGSIGGDPVVPGTLDPNLQGDLSSAKAGGKEIGTATAKAQMELPGTIAGADQTIGLIDQILAHPGLSDAVGVKGASMGFGLFPSAVPGTDAADFNAKLGQLQGKQFLEAFESLKGGGQITQIEGEKATNAIAAMQTAQSEKQFREAATAFRGVVDAAKQRALKRAQGGAGGASGSWSGPERRQGARIKFDAQGNEIP